MISFASGAVTEEGEGDATAVGAAAGGDDSVGLAAGAEALASGELGVCVLVTAAQLVDTKSSAATTVAGTTPLLRLPERTFCRAECIARWRNPIPLSETIACASA